MNKGNQGKDQANSRRVWTDFFIDSSDICWQFRFVNKVFGYCKRALRYFTRVLLWLFKSCKFYHRMGIKVRLFFWVVVLFFLFHLLHSDENLLPRLIGQGGIVTVATQDPVLINVINSQYSNSIQNLQFLNNIFSVSEKTQKAADAISLAISTANDVVVRTQAAKRIIDLTKEFMVDQKRMVREAAANVNVWDPDKRDFFLKRLSSTGDFIQALTSQVGYIVGGTNGWSGMDKLKFLQEKADSLNLRLHLLRQGFWDLKNSAEQNKLQNKMYDVFEQNERMMQSPLKYGSMVDLLKAAELNYKNGSNGSNDKSKVSSYISDGDQKVIDNALAVINKHMKEYGDGLKKSVEENLSKIKVATSSASRRGNPSVSFANKLFAGNSVVARINILILAFVVLSILFGGLTLFGRLIFDSPLRDSGSAVSRAELLNKAGFWGVATGVLIMSFIIFNFLFTKGFFGS